MPDSRTPATELETLNAVLASVGESPVDALGVDFVDAVIASNLLLEESRAAQTEGWHFNTENVYASTPTTRAASHRSKHGSAQQRAREGSPLTHGLYRPVSAR